MKPVLFFLLSLALLPSPAQARTTLFSLSIGYNGLPSKNRDPRATALAYADDDALAVHELARATARQSVILALPDRATQARYPKSREARPPSLVELRRALAELRAGIVESNQAGDETSVWLFYSGHGWLDDEGRANLTLADGALSQDMLYGEILPALPGLTVHLLIDACHAEALIRPRDVTAETVELSLVEVASASLRKRLGQLPNVGAIMASASNTQAHEWDEYQTGVFTHELLSGLRGGADVNGDGRVEYSEIAAFLAAANREVGDPRARLTTLVVGPRLYPRIPILDLRSAHTWAHLRGRAHHLGRFQVEDGRGNRLVDMRAESGFEVDLAVPAGEPITLSTEKGEARLVASIDRPTNLEEVVLNKSATRFRGAMVDSMRQGLFAAEFGPSYYGGFVDSAASGFVPVEMVPLGVRTAAMKTPRTRSRVGAWSAYATTGALAVATAISATLAIQARLEYQNTNLERPAAEANDRFRNYGMAAVGGTIFAIATGALGYWLWNRNPDGQAP